MKRTKTNKKRPGKNKNKYSLHFRYLFNANFYY